MYVISQHTERTSNRPFLTFAENGARADPADHVCPGTNLLKCQVFFCKKFMNNFNYTKSCFCIVSVRVRRTVSLGGGQRLAAGHRDTGRRPRPPPYRSGSCELQVSCDYGSCEASCIPGSYDRPQPTSVTKLAAA